MPYDMLFSPIKINTLELENRIVLAPIVSMGMVDVEGFVTPSYSDYVLRRAVGGAGMAILGAIDVRPLPGVPIANLGTDAHIPKMKAMVDRVHAESNCKIAPQLFDVCFTPPEELTLTDIKQEITDFIASAIRAREAGFDAIELHAAHDYLLSNFLSLTNGRKDEYGKDLKGRMKLLVEIYGGIREALGNDYPIGMRINGDEFIMGGNTLLHSMQIAKKMAGLGIDYISVSVGARVQDSEGILPGVGCKYAYPPVGGYSGYRAIPPKWFPEAVNVYLADKIKKGLHEEGYDIPIMTAGRIPYPQLAEDILERGEADLIGLARPLLRDPDWPLKAKEGREDEIEECAYCNKCMESLMVGQGHYCTFLHE